MIPPSVWIMGKLWTVEEKEGFFKDEGHYGDCIPSLLKIRVDSAVASQQVQDSLWHEIFHACEHSLGLSLPEKTVLQLATIQLQVMKDNPELIKFLMNHVENADQECGT